VVVVASDITKAKLDFHFQCLWHNS